MSSYIYRKFKDIKTNKLVNFDELTKIRFKISLGETECGIQHQSTISILLGEPASGKTFQLKEFDETNDKSYFVELVTFDTNEMIKKDMDIILIDSIDEALVDYSNPKNLQKKLTDFIKKVQETNPKVRFVISCRFLEWNEYFKDSLEKIDKELRIYKILPLSNDDINTLLKEKDIIEKEFWGFIDNNYLEPLLKNILVVLHMIDNFQDYQKQSLAFIDIYHDIVKKYLLKRGENRALENINKPVDELLLIASSIATYITFNRKLNIDATNLDELAGELYGVNDTSITASDLEIVLNSALFDKNDNKLSFFHKSIQEYLTACFLAEKNLTFDKLKELLASDLRFYEEFEEIVVYLTNIQEELFDSFVEFDPFIFKRHPTLTKEQQEKLLLSILNKYKVDYSQVWGRWESFEDSTLVRFDRLDNLVDLLKKYASLKNHGFYLMKLLEHNYTQELKEFMFGLFKNTFTDKKNLNEVIRRNFIDNYDFNLSLYNFMKQHYLLKKDLHVFMMSFEAELFSSLYGINYKFKYGEERTVNRTDIDFSKIISLLDFIPASSLKYIARYLLKEDAEKWLEYIKDNYVQDKYSYEFINWVVYSVLKHCESIDTYKNIASVLKEKKIYLYHVDKKEMQLDFENIANDFWQVYFETDMLQDFYTRDIISFYDISLYDIKKATDKYPIKDYLDKYVHFRLLGEDVDKFLMYDKDFKKYMQNEWKRQEEQRKKWDKDLEEKLQQDSNYILGKEQEKQLEKLEVDTLQAFDTDNEKANSIYNIFYFVSKINHGEWIEVDKKAKELLKDKYSIFIERIKEKFKTDITHKLLKKELTETSLSNTHTFMFIYLFEIMSDSETEEIIRTKKDYIKFFWHSYRYSLNSVSKNFIKFNQKYLKYFSLLSLHVLKLSLSHSEYKKIGNFHLLIDVYKKLNKFDYTNLKHIINYLKDNKLLLSIEQSYEREHLLEILSLDKEAFQYTLELMEQDKSKSNEYFKFLLRLDTPLAIEYFSKLYNSKKRNRPLWRRIKNNLFRKIKVVNNYDKFKINPEKIELYKNLILSIKKSKIDFGSIAPIYIEILLQDYYEFFEEYQTPEGAYSPDIYDDMDRLVSNIWGYVENNVEYIDILRNLQNSDNKRLSNRAKYALTKAYEEQRKDRSYPNSHYKKIFDEENKMKTEHPTVGDIKLEKDKWWLVSLIIGIIVGGVSWWQFTWMLGIVLSIISFLIMLFFNPKRRFWRAAWVVLALAGVSIFPKIIGILNIPENSIFNGIIKIGENMHPIIILGLLFLVGYLFKLDRDENKN